MMMEEEKGCSSRTRSRSTTKPEKPDVLPKTKRKRGQANSSSSRPSRKRRPKKSDIIETAGAGKRVEDEKGCSRRTMSRSITKTEKPDVLPKTKRKRGQANSSSSRSSRKRRPKKSDIIETAGAESNSSSARSSRKRRSKTPDIIEAAGAESESGSGQLRQSSWSSVLSISDDEELPPAVLCTPSNNSEIKKTCKKFDIVWIQYRKGEYRPCLITGVYKDYVCYKVIYLSKKYTYRAKLNEVIPFDDPVQNDRLLNEGTEKCPGILEAFDRVKHYFCRLAEQGNLSPLKYLFCERTEDLLYGIPDSEVNVKEEGERDFVYNDDEFEDSFLDNEDSDAESENKDEKNDDKSRENNISTEENDIYSKMTDDEKAKLLEKITVLLKVIDSEECFNYLKQIVEEQVECLRMKLLREDRETELLLKSGLGPFFGAERSETDHLTAILENHLNKLRFSGDVSLLQRHVLQPEAIIFALQTHCRLEREAAEEFFFKWSHEIPEWIET